VPTAYAAADLFHLGVVRVGPGVFLGGELLQPLVVVPVVGCSHDGDGPFYTHAMEKGSTLRASSRLDLTTRNV